MAAAAATTSMAATAVLAGSSPLRSATSFSALPFLPPRMPSTTPLFSASFKQISETKRTFLLPVKATSSDETAPLDTSELLADLKEKWDAVENKSTVILYGGGAVVAVWLSTTLVGAINTVPLLPKILELVGLGYTGWFVYRYLLFKSSRKELATEIEALKKKIAGIE